MPVSSLALCWQVLRWLGELRDEIVYQQGLPSEKRETEVALEALQKCVKQFDEYFKYATKEDLAFVRKALDATDS